MKKKERKRKISQIIFYAAPRILGIYYLRVENQMNN